MDGHKVIQLEGGGGGVEDKKNFNYIFPYPPENLWKNFHNPLLCK